MNILSQMNPFFYPRAVAVVGVSRDQWKFGSAMLLALKNFGGGLSIYPVSRSVTEFAGLKAYPTVAELPDDVELVIVCLPAPFVAGCVRECRQRNIPAVIVPGGGFADVATDEGRKLQAELAELIGENLRMVGPNCFGVYSPGGGLTILPGAGYSKTAGAVSFFAQSGAITEDFCDLSEDYGFSISKAVSYGNACDINESHLSRYFLADEKTKIVATYIEGISDGAGFFDTIKKAAATKPTIIWKGGLTKGGAKAAASHTGSMAGSNTAWGAFFKQTGTVAVTNMEEMLDTISAFSLLPQVSRPDVTVICGGGGIGVGASDACSRAGLRMAALPDETRRKLAAVLPPSGASVHNPVDCANPFPHSGMLAKILETVAASGCAGSIVLDKITPSVKLRRLLGYHRQVGWQDDDWLEELPVRIRNNYNIPVAVVLREGGEELHQLECEAERRRLRKYYLQNNVVVYATAARAMNALGRVMAYYRQREIKS